MRHQLDADRRVRKTRTRLHDALPSIVHEKPYDCIVVKEILARADVGRSTFYAHYRDKDELLDRGIRDLLGLDAHPSERWTGVTDRILRFSLPFLEHVEHRRELGVLPMDASGVAAIHERLRRVLETALTDELRAELRRARAARDDDVPAELLARHVAGAFVLTLGWWLEHPTRSARDVDACFRALVARAARGARDGAPATIDLPDEAHLRLVSSSVFRFSACLGKLRVPRTPHSRRRSSCRLTCTEEPKN